MENTSYKKDRPQLSENEILKNKDFNAALKNAAPKGNAFLKSIKYWGTGGVATIAIIASIYLFNNKTNIQNDSPNENFTYQPTDGLSQLTAIKPPFLEHDIAYEVFEIDCSKDAQIITKSGTIFSVAKNSLTDIEGNPITGIAEIHYRELRDPVDFFLSGIPMEYDSAGTTYTFESAGMLDIKAFQNEAPLLLAENKTIDFEFNSTTSDDGFNFYSLNEETGVWSMEDQCINVENEEAPQTQNKTTAPSIATQQPITPIKQNKVKYSLNLAVNKTDYPELEKYEGTIFEINESAEKFNPVVYKIQWENAVLSDSKIKDNYTLKLTREDSSIYLTVYPVVKDAYYKKAIAQYHKEMVAYKKNSNNNHDDFDAYEDDSDLSVSAEINNEITGVFYSNSKRRVTLASVGFGAVRRTFRLASLGVANCDMIQPPMRLPNLIAKKKTVDKNGKDLKVKNYYVANLQRNAIQSLTNTGGIKYYRRGESVAWFVGEDGFISIAHPKQFENIKNADALQFHIYPTRQGIDVLRDLMASK